MPDPNPRSGQEDEHINLVGDPLAEAQGKAKAPQNHSKKSDVFHQLPFMEKAQPWGSWQHARPQ